jgi:WD40 repeat protein
LSRSRGITVKNLDSEEEVKMKNKDSHPFGDLLARLLSRKHGLSQNKLAEGIGVDPAIISKMCHGERLVSSKARERILNIICWLRDQGVLGLLDEADELLERAGHARLQEDKPEESLLAKSLKIPARTRDVFVEEDTLITMPALLPHQPRITRRDLLIASLGMVVGAAGSAVTTVSIMNTSDGEQHDTRTTSEAGSRLVKVFRGHTYHVNAVVIHSNSDLIASGSGDKRAIIWDRRKGSLISEFSHDKWVGTVALTSRHLATSGGGGMIYVWDHVAQMRVANMPAHKGACRTIALSPDESWLVSGGEDGKICAWEFPSLKRLFVYEGHASEVRRLAISPDGRWLASVDAEGNVYLWNLNEHSFTSIYTNSDQLGRSIAYSRDGKTIAATFGTGQVMVWDIANDMLKWHIPDAHTGNAIGVTFHPQKPLLVTSGQDCLIKVWDLETKKLAITIAGHSESVSCVVFSTDGSWLVSCGRDETVRLWAF